MSTPENRSSTFWPQLLEHAQLHFLSARLHRCQPEWAISERIINDEMLHFVHRGSIVWQIAEQTFRSGPGDIVLCPPGVTWSARRDSTDLVHLTVVHFEASFSGGQRYLESLAYPYLIHPQRNVLFERIVRNLCRWDLSDDPARPLKLRALMFELFYHLFPYRGTISTIKREVAFAMEVAEYLQNNMHRPITRQMLAREFLMNAHSIATHFRRYTGQSPIDYLIRLRIRHAQQLLRTSDLTVSEVARRVGYDDAAYFTRLFKQKVGIAPQSYRFEQQSLYSGADAQNLR